MFIQHNRKSLHFPLNIETQNHLKYTINPITDRAQHHSTARSTKEPTRRRINLKIRHSKTHSRTPSFEFPAYLYLHVPFDASAIDSQS